MEKKKIWGGRLPGTPLQWSVIGLEALFVIAWVAGMELYVRPILAALRP